MGSGAADRVRALIVDDEEDFATAVAHRMSRRGFDAVAAFSGSGALSHMAARRFDVVVLDLKMPGMDGLTVLREIRRVDPHIQVVVLTGHGTVASGIEGMQLGAADFLQKPVGIEALCIAARAAAERTAERRAEETGGTRHE